MVKDKQKKTSNNFKKKNPQVTTNNYNNYNYHYLCLFDFYNMKIKMNVLIA